MEELQRTIELVSSSGVPIVLSCVVIAFLVFMGVRLPALIKYGIDRRAEQDKRNTEQYGEIITKYQQLLAMISEVSSQSYVMLSQCGQAITASNETLKVNQRALETVMDSFERVADSLSMIHTDHDTILGKIQDVEVQGAQIKEMVRRCE